MAIYFSNDGELDLDFIRVMGVSVKLKENPIGFFGTGIKFSIATLLRCGMSVSLTIGSKVYDFRLKEFTLRGETFQRVMMNDEELPFTSDLGKNWEVWQAYRELHSNTLDEDGVISDQPQHGDTVFCVSGEAIEKAYRQRGTIFLEDREPVCKNASLEVYAGQSQFIYYRGVRVGEIGRATHTYNIIEQTDLTEDRTLKSVFDAQWVLQRNLPKMDDLPLLRQIIEGDKLFDQGLDFEYCGRPSEAFFKACSERASEIQLNQSARRILEKKTKEEASFNLLDEVPPELDRMLMEGLDIAHAMGADCTREELHICTTLGSGVAGLYHQDVDKIFLSQAALENGVDYIAATIFEEWVHKHYKVKDHTRAFQDAVLQRFVQVTKEKMGM